MLGFCFFGPGLYAILSFSIGLLCCRLSFALCTYALCLLHTYTHCISVTYIAYHVRLYALLYQHAILVLFTQWIASGLDHREQVTLSVTILI